MVQHVPYIKSRFYSSVHREDSTSLDSAMPRLCPLCDFSSRPVVLHERFFLKRYTKCHSQRSCKQAFSSVFRVACRTIFVPQCSRKQTCRLCESGSQRSEYGCKVSFTFLTINTTLHVGTKSNRNFIYEEHFSVYMKSSSASIFSPNCPKFSIPCH